jgi:hypothetical protein
LPKEVISHTNKILDGNVGGRQIQAIQRNMSFFLKGNRSTSDGFAWIQQQTLILCRLFVPGASSQHPHEHFFCYQDDLESGTRIASVEINRMSHESQDSQFALGRGLPAYFSMST